MSEGNDTTPAVVPEENGTPQPMEVVQEGGDSQQPTDTTGDTATEQQDDQPATPEEMPATHVVGIDLGTDTAVVSLVSLQSLRPDLLRNDLSHQQTPFSVCLHGRERSFGELAVQKLTSKLHLQNSVNGPAVFGAMENRTENEPVAAVGRLDSVEDSKAFRVEYDSQEMLLRPDQVMSMFLAKVKGFVASSLAKEENANSANVPVGIVIPETFEESHRHVVQRACKIAKLNLDLLITRSAAAAMTYGTKKSREILDSNRRVMIVDIGSGYGTVSVYRWGEESKAAPEKESEKEEDAPKENLKQGVRLAYRCSANIGANMIDSALFTKLVDQCKTKYGFNVQQGTKAATRLMTQTIKLKKTLSQVAEGKITVESVGPDGEDASLAANRADLEAACTDYRVELKKLITECLEESLTKSGLRGDETAGFLMGGAELVGGGTYVPWIQSVIQECVKTYVDPKLVAADPKLGGLCFTLDSMAAPAIGASYLVAQRFEPTGAIVRPVFDTLAKLVNEGESECGVYSAEGDAAFQVPWLEEAEAIEAKMQANDAEMSRMHSERNKLEAYLFECRSIANGSREFSSLVNKDEMIPLLDQAEEWLWDEGDISAPDASWQKYHDKAAELAKAFEEPMRAYNAKVEEVRVEMENKLKEEAEKAALEAANTEKDDHDFRKLKKPERMRKVTMNKEEGVSLFKDGNFEAASLRFIRALQHTTKFFDLSPADEEEVNGVKHSLHLNLAQCYIKLTNWDEVIKSCTNALEVEENSVKALYRRAMAYEKTRKFDQAKKDILKAQNAMPDDKAIGKLKDRIDAQLKLQAAKQKKMAQKMFG